MKKYIVNTPPSELDPATKKRYAVGAIIKRDAGDEETISLVACGALTEIPDSEEPKAKAEKPAPAPAPAPATTDAKAPATTDAKAPATADAKAPAKK